MKVYSALASPGLAKLGEKSSTTTESGFGQLLQGLIKQAVDNQVLANEQSVKLALGETDDVQAVMIAAEKASLSWQLLQQVQSKLLEAYQEVMRMQM